MRRSRTCSDGESRSPARPAVCAGRYKPGVAAVDPDLEAVTSAFIASGAKFVVVGGFAVVAHRHVRATEDVDLLIPDEEANDSRCSAALEALDATVTATGAAASPIDLLGREHLRVLTRGGLVDLIREGAPPLDFATVAADAIEADLGAGPFKIAGLRALVAMKRLAGRPRDKLDLEALAEEHGELPQDPIPGLDDL